MWKFFAVLLVFGATKPAHAMDCERLRAEFSRFDNAAVFFDRRSRAELASSRGETSSVRSASNGVEGAAMQAALTNILLRQSMILEMMVAGGCDLPPPPDFLVLGLIASHN